MRGEKSTYLEKPDVVLVGGGVMSATLGIMLKELSPKISIQVIESLPSLAQESSDALNNAGTGHAALCELNYTPQKKDGTIDISKAKNIFESFEMSKQFWAYLTEIGVTPNPEEFIRRVPHMSVVFGEENEKFLHKRYEALKSHHFFSSMEYTTNHDTITQWAPLLTENRDPKETIGLTRVIDGTDVDFGVLTRLSFQWLKKQKDVALAVNTRVKDFSKNGDGTWFVHAENDEGRKYRFVTKFVFLGAGGGTLPLLQKSGIPEGEGFGGFPVSGQFLVCKKKDIVEKHHAKIYGKAAVGAPPMSVPHLDTRVVQGEKSLLFGPFAGFSPKYLKHGSIFDMLKSVSVDNLEPMVVAGLDNLSLVQYLIKEVMNSHEDRIAVLREFYPDAKPNDWELITAGQRVQIIKRNEKGGSLQFGTEVVSAGDGSLAALLGASPGASTCAPIALTVLEKCFPDLLNNEKVKNLVPTYGKNLAHDAELFDTTRDRSNQILRLESMEHSVNDDNQNDSE